MTKKNKVIIFDMDNTLVHSKIDFGLMLKETNRLLDEAGVEHERDKPVSYILQSCASNPLMTSELSAKIWTRIDEIEAEGMVNAGLEQGADEALRQLSAKCELMLLSNNRKPHIEAALNRLDLAKYFSTVAGRDMVAEMKPKPDGYLYLRNLRPDLASKDFIAVGDATIDIIAASQAGISFVAYNSSRKENWENCEYTPIAYLERWNKDAWMLLEELLFGED